MTDARSSHIIIIIEVGWLLRLNGLGRYYYFEGIFVHIANQYGSTSMAKATVLLSHLLEFLVGQSIIICCNIVHYNSNGMLAS